jgi:integrase
MNGPPFSRHPTNRRAGGATPPLCFPSYSAYPVAPMAYTDVAGDTVQVVQEKTDQAESDEKLVIPMHPALQRELSLHRRKHAVIVAPEWGQPFTVKGFQQFVAKAIRAAGLPGICKAHGLRKAAARRLAEAGCTAKQIQAITSHKTLAEVERYTRKADQVRLARQAIQTLQEADGEFGNSPKIQSISKPD